MPRGGCSKTSTIPKRAPRSEDPGATAERLRENNLLEGKPREEDFVQRAQTRAGTLKSSGGNLKRWVIEGANSAAHDNRSRKARRCAEKDLECPQKDRIKRREGGASIKTLVPLRRGGGERVPGSLLVWQKRPSDEPRRALREKPSPWQDPFLKRVLLGWAG